MNYHVIIERNGNWQTIAQCLFYEDAKKVLDNWHSGYISYNGEIVFQKNVRL